jgi:hypothetical protein
MAQSDSNDTPIRGLRRGLLAGVAGTAAMTAVQTGYYKATGAEPSSTPAEVGKRIIRGVLQRSFDDRHENALNHAMHWAYGTGWGALYGLAARRPTRGLAFGALVWGASLVELPAMKLAPPVWEMEPASVAPDLGFHLVFGAAVALSHRALAE